MSKEVCRRDNLTLDYLLANLSSLYADPQQHLALGCMQGGWQEAERSSPIECRLAEPPVPDHPDQSGHLEKQPS